MFDGEDGRRSPENIGQTEVRIFSRAGKYKEEQNIDEEYNNGQKKKKKHQKESMVDWMVQRNRSELEDRVVEISEAGEKKEGVRMV